MFSRETFIQNFSHSLIAYPRELSKYLGVFQRCCLYVSKLEHDFFGRNQNPSLPKTQQKKEKKDATNGEPKGSQDKLKLNNFNIAEEEETW